MLEKNTKNRTITTPDIIAILLFIGYYFVDYIPFIPTYSRAEPQWVYLCVYNIFVIGYFFYDKKILSQLNLGNYFKNKIPLLYFVFLMLSTVSLVSCFNLFEGIIALSRYYITFIAFINLYVLFHKRSYLFMYLCAILTISLGLQSYVGLMQIFDKYSSESFGKIIFETVLNHGNKNIFSASILAKIPFVIYCIIQGSGWKRVASLLVLVLSTLLLFILSTRALVGALVLMTLVFVVFSFRYKLSSLKNNVFIGVTVLVSFLIAQLVIKNGLVVDNDDVLARNANISLQDQSFQIRLNFWESSFEAMKENPVLGCGVGNWKIESIKYERKWKTTNTNGIHMHNDFLEVPVESGIINGLIYIALMALLFFGIFKKVLAKEIDNKDKKLVSLVLFLAIIGYGVDSFFNFPLHRPTVQILFVFIVLFAVSSIVSNKEMVDEDTDLETFKISNSTKLILGIALGLSVFILYPNYLQYKFYNYFNTIQLDAKKYNLTYTDIENNLPAYPNLILSTTPVATIKAEYLIQEKRYKEAEAQLDLAVKQNPLALITYTFKALIAQKTKPVDSVIKQNKKLHDLIPYFDQNYETYIQNLSTKKDSSGILKTFTKLDSTKTGPKFYGSTFKFLLDCNYDPKKSYAILKKGIARFPKDTLLSRLDKNFVAITAERNKIKENRKQIVATTPKTTTAVAKKETPLAVIQNNNDPIFETYLKSYLAQYTAKPNDPDLNKNIGLCYFKQNKFQKAIPYLIKAVNSNYFLDGEPQYMLAMCYFSTNQREKGCKNAQKSLALGYYNKSELNKIITINCK